MIILSVIVVFRNDTGLQSEEQFYGGAIGSVPDLQKVPGSISLTCLPSQNK